jgi:hypothetical protein
MEDGSIGYISESGPHKDVAGIVLDVLSLKILSEMSTVTTNLQTSTISTCHA